MILNFLEMVKAFLLVLVLDLVWEKVLASEELWHADRHLLPLLVHL